MLKPLKMNTYLKIVRRGSVLFAAMWILSILGNVAWAEGSKNLTPGTNPTAAANGQNDYIGYLQHGDGLNSNNFLLPNATDLERLYVHLLPGDTLFYGVRRRNTNETVTFYHLRLQVMLANNMPGQTTILAPTAVGSNNNAPLAAANGVIASYAEAAAGPRYKAANTLPTTGYKPLYYVNPANGTERDVWVEFYEVNADGSVNNVTQRKSWYDLWDFTVRRGSEKKGRLFAKSWSFTGGAFDAQFATSFALYPLIPNPNAVGGYASQNSFFVKQVSYARVTPFGLLVVANSQGTTVTGSFRAKRKSQLSNLGYAEYKMFINNPDVAVYPTTVAPNQPTVTAVCNAANKTTTFTLNVDQAGFGIVFIDGNNNGTYERVNDRVLEKLTNVGNNDFVWDGTSDSGVQMPAAQISLTFSSGVGPVNFPMFDCEAADFGGITVRQVRPGAPNVPDYVFYNDSLLATGFSTPQINPIGNNSATGGHHWSTAGASTGPLTGDGKLVNTYAVGLLARGQAVNLTYNNDGCAAPPAPIVLKPLPVELTRFGAAAQRGQVGLSWETASEHNSSYFLAERSTDGLLFEPVGRVAAQGSTSTAHAYRLVDTTPPAGLLYYRLQQVDLDGTAHFSPVVPVQLAEPTTTATIYPNPVEGTLHLRPAPAARGTVAWEIVDLAGRVAGRGQLESTGSELIIPTTNLLPGSYVLRLRSTAGQHNYRFVK